MKRHIQKTGVRKFFGQDFIDLQAEPLRALDTFFAEYGACVIQGCDISANGDGTYDVAAGLVAIEAAAPETGDSSIKVMPFDGATGVALPLYLTAVGAVDERVYGDGRVKPIAIDFRAVASGVEPLGAHIVLSEAVGNRFVDVLQDDTHAFVSTAERARWNDILRLAKEYAKQYADAREVALRTDMAVGDVAALRSAGEYTDARERIVRTDMAAADVSMLNSAKSYADQIVAALVDGSPELLNTLEELAGALGNDPNFATTVMTEIGKRVTTEAMTAALAEKAAGNHSHSANDVANVWHSGNFDPISKMNSATSGLLGGIDLNSLHSTGFYDTFDVVNAPCPGWIYLQVIKHSGGANWVSQTAYTFGGTNAPNRIFHRNGMNTNDWSPWVEYYHTGNLTRATDTADGLMAATDKGKLDAIDKNKLDAMPTQIIRGSIDENGKVTGGRNFYTLQSGDSVFLAHNLNTLQYAVIANVISNAPGHDDNVVAISSKTTSSVVFRVTAGNNTNTEKAPFDFVIITY